MTYVCRMTPAASQKRMASMQAHGARSRPVTSEGAPLPLEETASVRGKGFSQKLLPAAAGVALLGFAARADPAWLQQHLYQPGHYVPPGAAGAWELRGVAVLAALLCLFVAARVRDWGGLLRGAAAIAAAVLVVEVAV